MSHQDFPKSRTLLPRCEGCFKFSSMDPHILNTGYYIPSPLTSQTGRWGLWKRQSVLLQNSGQLEKKDITTWVAQISIVVFLSWNVSFDALLDLGSNLWSICGWRSSIDHSSGRWEGRDDVIRSNRKSIVRGIRTWLYLDLEQILAYSPKKEKLGTTIIFTIRT